ncbi:ABC transporter permease [Actinomyces vulturis]|uniref:ABC transporter permease n=1 Tax=Actinomyces vulturis TaxID=1857645 RepID=UPI0008319CFB|nr:FtsX-like permease family protein [Actinomyces vulturis]
MTGFLGALVEAWAQLRIGKLRVLLSLVGVAVAVAAMTFVVALGQISVKVLSDINEQYTGRPGTVTVEIAPKANGDSSSDGSADTDASSLSDGTDPNDQHAKVERVQQAMNAFVERYHVNLSDTFYNTNLRLSFPEGASTVNATVVSGQYGMLHRTEVEQGRWFRPDDADDLSPSIVVSQSVLTQLGMSELTGPVTIDGFSPARVTYTIVGVLPEDKTSQRMCEGPDGNFIDCGTEPLTAYVLADSFNHWLPRDFEMPMPTLELWAGKDGAKQIESLAKKDFDATFGSQATTARDNLMGSELDGFATFFKVVISSGVAIMLLGALGLVNISMVTVRQRIHEIGVRRSFGATNKRIFFSIMLESVVATVVAGLVGIAIAIIGVRVMDLSVIFGEGFAPKVTPPFPMMAAFVGLASATVVGALAGIIPAIVAVKIKPIDAIRY